MTAKNVTETAYDEFVEHVNELLREENALHADHNHSSDTGAFNRRGEDTDFFGHCRCVTT